MHSPLNRGGIRFYLIIFALIGWRSTTTYLAFGTALLLIGVALHCWAKGCLQRDKEVTMIGPYRFVRHPFYLANALIDSGIVVSSGYWLLGLVFPFWWIGVYLPVIRQEEAYLTEHFPETYKAYRSRIPALLPTRRPLPIQSNSSSWQIANIISEQEAPRVLRLLTYPLFFFLWHQFRTYGTIYFKSISIVTIIVVTLMIALRGIAWQMKRQLKIEQI